MHCHAEDVLGAFFGRHAHMGSDIQPAFGGQPQQNDPSSHHMSEPVRGLCTSDSASSTPEACTSNIVPLPYQRLHGSQRSMGRSKVCTAQASNALLVGSGAGSPSKSIWLSRSHEPYASDRTEMKHHSPPQRRLQAQRVPIRGLHARAAGMLFWCIVAYSEDSIATSVEVH